VWERGRGGEFVEAWECKREKMRARGKWEKARENVERVGEDERVQEMKKKERKGENKESN